MSHQIINEVTALTAIESAEAAIAKLGVKRDGIKRRMAVIDKERAMHAFAALAEDNKDAQKLLAALATEVIKLDQEAASIDAALDTAKLKLETAQAAERTAETKKAAREAQTNYKWLVQNGPKLSEHALALAMLLEEAKRRIDENHARGYAFPTSMQFISAMTRATSAMVMTLPFKNFEHSFLPPGQRFDYGQVLAGWGATGLRNIEQQFSNLNGGEPQQKAEHHASA